jgi:hypothetical protein
VTEEAFEVNCNGRRLPYTTERPRIGLGTLPRFRPVTQITFSVRHAACLGFSVPVDRTAAVAATTQMPVLSL